MNNITLAEKYLPILDEVYKAEAKSSVLDGDKGIQFAGGNQVRLFKTDMDGFGNYSRNNGFVTGDMTSGWETLTLAQDRGISLTVDNMDNEETLGMAFGTMSSEFIRTKEVPELDAYRFARYASWTGVDAPANHADITVGSTDVPELIAAAEESMNENEVPYEGRILFVSEKCYHGLKAKITRKVDTNQPTLNNAIEMYDDMRIIHVPQNRFNTAITLYDGSTQYGYAPTAGGYKINFMIVHPSAIVQVVKHRLPRIWTPNENLNADAYKFDLRCYHDAFVKANKVKGIYVHHASTANV